MQYIFQFVKNSFWVEEFILAREFGLNSNSNWCFHAVNCLGCREPGGLLGKTAVSAHQQAASLTPSQAPALPHRPPPSHQPPAPRSQARCTRSRGPVERRLPQCHRRQRELQPQMARVAWAASWILGLPETLGWGDAYVPEPVCGRWVFPAWPVTRPQGSGWEFMVQVKACLQTDDHIQTNKTRSQQPPSSTVSPSYCRCWPWVGVQDWAGPRLVPRGQADFVIDPRWRWEHKVLKC